MLKVEVRGALIATRNASPYLHVSPQRPCPAKGIRQNDTRRASLLSSEEKTGGVVHIYKYTRMRSAKLLFV
jgi:hypothetical protein